MGNFLVVWPFELAYRLAEMYEDRDMETVRDERLEVDGLYPYGDIARGRGFHRAIGTHK